MNAIDKISRTIAAAAAILAVSAFAFPAAAQGGPGAVESYRMSRDAKQGDESFHEGRYDRARAGYMRAKDRAGEKSGESYKLHFNIGDTFYKEGNYDEAEKEFNLAAGSPDPRIREKAYYNLGNVYFQKGQQAKDIQLWSQAIEYYQKALELNPNNEDARHNVEVIRRLIKREQEKQKQQEEQNQEQEDQKQQDQDKDKQPEKESEKNPQKENTPDKDHKEQQDKSPENQNAQEKNEKEKQNQEQTTGTAQGGTTKEKSPNAAPPEENPDNKKAPGELSKDEAERILSAVESKEKEDIRKVRDHSTEVRKERDW